MWLRKWTAKALKKSNNKNVQATWRGPVRKGLTLLRCMPARYTPQNPGYFVSCFPPVFIFKIILVAQQVWKTRFVTWNK